MNESDHYLKSAMRMVEDGEDPARILEILQLRADLDAKIAENSPYGAGILVSPLRSASNFLCQRDVE